MKLAIYLLGDDVDVGVRRGFYYGGLHLRLVLDWVLVLKGRCAATMADSEFSKVEVTAKRTYALHVYF